MKKITLQFLFIVLISITIGLIYNSSLQQPLPIFSKYDSHFISSVRMGKGTNSETESVKAITADDLFTRLNDDQLIIIDARQTLEFEMGHIPGAINLPLQTFAVEFPNLEGEMDKKKTVVTYCSELSCTDSELLAQKLIEQGFSKVFVYKGGFKEWLASGYPVDKLVENKSEGPIEKNSQ